MTTPTLEALIAQFTDELTQLVRRDALQQVLSALGGDEDPRAAGRPRATRKASSKPRPARAGRRVRRSTEDVAGMGERLLAHVKANPGQRGEQIAAALKTDVKTMRLPMLKLIAEKKVRTEGQRRGMTYFASGGGGGGGGGARKARATKKKRGRVIRKKSSARRARKASSKPARKPRRKSGRKPARKARAQAKRSRPRNKPAKVAPLPAPVVEAATDAQQTPSRSMTATA